MTANSIEGKSHQAKMDIFSLARWGSSYRIIRNSATVHAHSQWGRGHVPFKGKYKKSEKAQKIFTGYAHWIWFKPPQRNLTSVVGDQNAWPTEIISRGKAYKRPNIPS